VTAVAWAALAAALLLVPVRAPVTARLGALAGADRLLRGARPRRIARPPAVPGRVLAGCIAIACAAMVAVVAGPALAVAAAAVLGLAVVLIRDVRARREQQARQRDLVTSVQVLVAEFESGAGPPAALTAAAAVGPRLRASFLAAAAAAARGDPAGPVLTARDVPGLRAVGQAFQLGEETGAPLVGVLGRVAADLAAAQQQRRAVSVALAGPRSSAAVLSGLPVLGIGLGVAMGARPLPFLLGTPPGRLLCCAGVVLDVTGVLWMRRILRRAERP
jgi:tight adherence protein B